MKYVVVIGDGMADETLRELGGKTPLQAAKTPVMDALAQAGEVGLVQTVPCGLPPGSDTAILSIFGYDAHRYYTGRAPLEAAADGVLLQEGDVAYRCNMITLRGEGEMLEEKTIASHSGGSVEGETSRALLSALLRQPEFAACAEKHRVRFYPADSFRHIMVQRGCGAGKLHMTPPHDHLGEKAGPLLPHGAAEAEGLCEMMRLAHRILEKHPLNARRGREGKLPANGIWFWAQGRAAALPGFEEKTGKKAFVVSAVPLVRGIAALAGLPSVEVPGATGELDTNYVGKANAVLTHLLKKGFDVAVLHIEAPDECTHSGDRQGKLQAIEWLDTRALRPLKAGLDQSGQPWRMLLLSDHKTVLATRRHEGGAVPYVLYDSRGTEHGGGITYSEQSAQSGPLCREGHTLMRRLLEE